MSTNKLEEIVQSFASESNLLKEFIYLLHSFSDYLYFLIIISEIMEERFKEIIKFKKVDFKSSGTFSNSFVSIINNLNHWAAQNTNSKLFLKNKTFSKNFIDKINVKNKNKVLRLIEAAEKKLTDEQKVQFILFVGYSITIKLTQLLFQMNGISIESKRGNIVDFASSPAFQFPILSVMLLPFVKDDIDNIKNLKYSKSYTVTDADVDSGNKKGIYIAIDTAMRNAYLEYITNLIQAFVNFDKNNIENAEKSLENVLFFLTNEDNCELPSEDVESFNSKLNLKTLLDYIKVSPSTLHNNNLLVLTIPNDIERRRFYIQFPTNEFQLFSSVNNIARAREYEMGIPQFILKYEGERYQSIRAEGIRRIIDELSFFKKEIVLKKSFDTILDNASDISKDTSEALFVGSITYILNKIFAIGNASETAVIAGLVDYMKSFAMSKKST